MHEVSESGQRNANTVLIYEFGDVFWVPGKTFVRACSMHSTVLSLNTHKEDI